MKEITFDSLRCLIPKRIEKSHKGSFGTLLSVCGSAYYRGAALLSCEAALRSGVGILRLASTERVCAAVVSSLPEVTFLPQAEDENGSIREFNIEDTLEKFPSITAILCGCGLTKTQNTVRIVGDVIRKSKVRLILDADAINCIAGIPEILKEAKFSPIITPHWGEFSRLCGISVKQIEENAKSLTADFAKKYNCVLVLKSHFTLIATPGGKVYVSNAGNPGLARGGSGDILAGIIASLVAQGLESEKAAMLGVVLHGSSADKCAERLGMTGMLPHDIIYDMTNLLKER
ncbi:MAG: NAD(P)H-hydrate dehydratase [Clostridia bacterium]|nr:NAD(P)H-hydrate dehydratase [Clostridia bacterium]